jgi:hypothetical protein
MYTPLIIEKKVLAPGTVILSGNFKLEENRRFKRVLGSVKNTKSFYARHRMYHLLLFLGH